MTNSKAVREQLLKQAGAKRLPNDKFSLTGTYLKPNLCFTCKSCWRRSLQSDLDDLRCPFCSSAMYEVRP